MDEPLFSVAGRRAIVTGASSGIGRAIALLLCKHGAMVVGVGRSEAKLRSLHEELGPARDRFLPMSADLMTMSGASAAVQASLQSHGGIDVLVHSAGIFVPNSFGQIGEGEFAQQWKMNVVAPFALTQAALPHLGSGSSVIFLSSTSARVGMPNTAAYSATKGGVDAMMRVLAVELAGRAICVNSIAPGWIESPMNAEKREDQSIVAAAISCTPAGRLGVPNDIAPAILFLASNASRFIQGQVIEIAGGFPSIPDVIGRN